MEIFLITNPKKFAKDVSLCKQYAAILGIFKFLLIFFKIIIKMYLKIWELLLTFKIHLKFKEIFKLFKIILRTQLRIIFNLKSSTFL